MEQNLHAQANNDFGSNSAMIGRVPFTLRNKYDSTKVTNTNIGIKNVKQKPKYKCNYGHKESECYAKKK